MGNGMKFLPRLIRLRDAPAYLGMDPNRFNAEVRPNLTEVPIGKRGIAFDRLDLDAWADEYVARNGRPGKTKGGKSWGERSPRVSSNEVGSGTFKSGSSVQDFERALEQMISQKPNST